MNKFERILITTAIGVIMQRADDLVESGVPIDQAKKEALAGYTFSENTKPFKSIITTAVRNASLYDMGKASIQKVKKDVYQQWLIVNGRKDCFVSRLSFALFL